MSPSSDAHYSIKIPANVERKFRKFCSLSPALEWSGVLFYKITGTFEDKNLTVHCVDFLLMDQGTQVATEVNFDTPEIAGYMAQNPELLDCYQGLCHSHNVMSSFFSGTDVATLEQEGKNMNNFVSLIVNNAGVYTAGITRRITYNLKKEIKSTGSGEYPFFNLGVKKLNTVTKQETKEEAVTQVEWVELAIDKEAVTEVDEDINRFQEVLTNKKPKAQTAFNAESKEFEWKPKSSWSFDDAAEYPSLFDQKSTRQTFTASEYEKEELELYADSLDWDKSFDTFMVQLIKGSPFASHSDGNLNKLKNTLETVYKNRFHTVANFQNWFDSYIDWLFSDYDCEWIYESLPLDVYDCHAIMAIKAMKIVETFPKGEFRDAILQSLEAFTY